MPASLPTIARALAAAASWPRRRFAALLAIPLPPLDLRARDVDRQLHRRNTRVYLDAGVRALLHTPSLN